MRANSKLTAIVAAILTAAALLAAPAPTQSAQAETHHVGYDRYSLTVDGQRVLLWAGEFHYFRLPSPALWRDVLEKIKCPFTGHRELGGCGVSVPGCLC
ncbi:beta-galactosidase [Actinomadura sp. BRA 177]|uniref:beta-galactosidase n=1 Tax=Actinomadura sp. BRA 177 TaxID=2745202 RepID=UPI001595E569|nr:beta-galactosidase [Actinomadura sp. BRA 177]NVI90634.1 beta-galactosidase [Actinomadura sp. BRA 177]